MSYVQLDSWWVRCWAISESGKGSDILGFTMYLMRDGGGCQDGDVVRPVIQFLNSGGRVKRHRRRKRSKYNDETVIKSPGMG